MADYQAAGVDVLDRLATAGRPAILVGGSGLHFRSLVDPIHPAPTDPELRTELEAASVDDLVAELRRHDPHAGAVLDLANPRRVVRAVEVLRLTGATPTQRAGATPDLVGYRPARPFVAVGLDPGDSLASRVDRRLQAMVDAGLLDEVRRLRHRLGQDGPPGGRLPTTGRRGRRDGIRGGRPGRRPPGHGGAGPATADLLPP